MEISNARCVEMAKQVLSGDIEKFAHHESDDPTEAAHGVATIGKIVKVCGKAIATLFAPEILQSLVTRHGKANVFKILDQTKPPPAPPEM